MSIDSAPPIQKGSDKYILRFERPNHRAELKAQAALAKRSLNKQILHLIEKGEEAERTLFVQGAQQ